MMLCIDGTVSWFFFFGGLGLLMFRALYILVIVLLGFLDVGCWGFKEIQMLLSLCFEDL
jgi:hypothetical protein